MDFWFYALHKLNLKIYMFLKNLKTNEIAQFANIQEGWIVATETETQNYLLLKAKEAKLAQLKMNLDNESKKPFSLIGVKQIDKDGKVIGTVNAFYNIQDANSLTDSANIIFAGSIMIIQALIKLLCEANKIDFEAIRTQVNALSDSSNPAIAFKNNIPYTTKDVENKEIRVLLSYQKIQEIFAHIFNRVATKTNLFNIIEEKIKKATSIEELEKIDINLN